MEKNKVVQDAIRGLNQALTLIELASESVGRGAGGHEVSLARTDCQSARDWLVDASRELDMEGHICPSCGGGLCSCGLCHNTRTSCKDFSSQCLNDN